MSEDGGPAYSGYRLELTQGLGGYPDGIRVSREMLRPIAGMSLREHYAGEIAKRTCSDPSKDRLWITCVFDEAQRLTNEAVKRRGEDATELQLLRAENVKMKARIAEFIDGERRGEPEPRPSDDMTEGEAQTLAAGSGATTAGEGAGE